VTATPWETVQAPRGAYISWGQVGQRVTGQVLSYSEDGGTDFNGKPCPQLEVELTEPAYSVNREGQRSEFGVGEIVVINAGQVSLKRNLRAARPKYGDLVQIEYARNIKADRGNVKEFEMKIARDNTPAPDTAAADDEPPF